MRPKQSVKPAFILAAVACWFAHASPANAELPPGGEYHWSQGQTAVPMGSASGRVCFLTGVTGKFEGGGEAVRTFIAGGSWYLGGQSQQVGIAASARCVQVSAYSDEHSWSQGNVPVYMGPALNRACFLTRVTGKFKGGGEQIHAYVSSGAWYLGGESQQFDVGAGARCVDVGASSEYGWRQGDHPAYLGEVGDRACFLTRMTGKFEGGGEVVRVYTLDGAWFLGGSSQQHGVGASARCI